MSDQPYIPIDDFTNPCNHSARVVPLWVDGKPEFGMSASVSSIDFGDQIINFPSSPFMLQLVNTGFTPLLIESVVLSGPFQSSVVLPTTLAVSGVTVVPISFYPTGLGAFSGSVTVNTKQGESVTVTLTGNGTSTSIEAAKVTYIGPDGLTYSVQDMADPTKGSRLIMYEANTTLYDAIKANTAAIQENAETINWLPTTATVEKYGAVGDGVADDSQAFRDMYAATGTIILGPKSYNVGHLLITGESIVVVGSRNPHINADKTALVGGTIILGTFLLRTNNAYLRNFGTDAGVASGYPVGTEGFVCDAIEYTRGVFLDADSITTLGRDSMNTTHGFLFEGYDGFRVSNITVALRYYGVVCKSRNGTIDNVHHIDMGGCGVFAKSDTPNFGGWVTDSTVSNVIITNVIGTTQPAMTELVGVYVYASSAILSGVQVRGVRQLYGRTALAVTGGFDSVYAVDVMFDDIEGDAVETVVSMGGTVFDVVGGSIRGDNHTSGQLFGVGVLVSNWRIESAVGSIASSSITGTYAATPFGVGSWGHIQVRNGVLAYQTVPEWSTVTPGTVSGNVQLTTSTGDGPITLDNGWAATSVDGVSTTPTAYVDGKFIELAGSVTSASATAATINSAGITLPSVASYYVVSCTSAGVRTTGQVRVWLNGIILMSPPLATNLTVDLTGIRWHV